LLERESPAVALTDYAPAPWNLLQCVESGFVFLENPPGYEALKEEFAWQTTHAAEAEARQAAEPVLHAVSQSLGRVRTQVLRRNKVRDLVRSEVLACRSPQVRLLDIGCGWGNLLGELLEELPAEVRDRCVPCGIELSTELAQCSHATLAAAGGYCLHADALSGLAQSPADAFDVIVLSSFLEHEVQPLPVLRGCRRCLRPGGTIVIKVPNYGCLNRKLRGRRWCGFRWPDHVNYFKSDTLRAMAAAADLDVARMHWRDRHQFSDSLYAVLRRPLTQPVRTECRE
jgi:2-polyprenyl-3-methyl-5-hydroxy-6-metoxy-1,4-benzoquinol methylase